MRAPLRTSTAAALLTLLLGGLSACNDDPGAAGGKADEASSAAESSAGASGTPAAPAGDPGSDDAAPTAGAAVSTSDVTKLLEDASSAFRTARVHMKMDMSAMGQDMTVVGNGSLQTEPLAQAMTIDVSGRPMEMRLVDGNLYLKAPMLSAGDKWIRVALSELDDLGMGSFSDMLANPSAMAAQVAPHITRATYVGTEDVGGVEARHYRTEIDVAGLLGELDVPSGAGVDLPEAATQDFWIDGQGRMVKMVQKMAPLQTMTMTMSDFDQPVDVDAPPADEVTDMPGGTAGS